MARLIEYAGSPPPSKMSCRRSSIPYRRDPNDSSSDCGSPVLLFTKADCSTSSLLEAHRPMLPSISFALRTNDQSYILHPRSTRPVISPKTSPAATPLSSGSLSPQECRRGTPVSPWACFNEEGTREIYMKCAPIMVTVGVGTIDVY